MDIEVGEGKTVVLKGLYQTGTYSGLLEGLPTDKMNARILNSAKESARKVFHIQEVYLIEPEQKPLKTGWYPFGKPAALPKIECIAELWHYQPARNSGMDFSALVVIWYQENFALPIEAKVLEQLRELPWNDVAGDFDY